MQAATFMKHSKPVNKVEGGILKALRARRMILTTVAVPYDWLERCKSLFNKVRFLIFSCEH